MSEASVQFVEAVRQAAVKIEPNRNHPLYCQQCGRCTDHVMTCSSSGQWEYYTCLKCGRQEQYCVK